MSLETSRVFVRKKGAGPKTLLLFHGFGQDHTALLPVANAVTDRYTCYLFDLYHHGQSHWRPGDTPIEKTDWKLYLKGFLLEHQIDAFSVLGFSLGARLALASLEAFPERTEALFLIAPDGLRASPWYTLATGSHLTRKIFHAAITRPGIFFTLADTLHRWGWLDARLHRVAGHYMGSPQKREQVYHAWVGFRRLKSAPRRLAALIRQHSIRTVIIVGARDTFIPPARVQALVKYLRRAEYTLLLLPAAHHQLLGDELIGALHAGFDGD
jgi:pimeloyl-ACP methyl ester carboxylesterase